MALRWKSSWLLLLFVAGFVRAQGEVRTLVDSLYAKSLGRTKRFAVILPSGYDQTKKYPVLYLLHGYGGNYQQWMVYSHIKEYAASLPVVVVMPDAEASYYVNSLTVPRDRFEDYLTEDLPALLQAKYAIDPRRQAIAGASMGGYGALVLALKHPHRFFFAGDISGAIDIPRHIEERKGGPMAFSLPGLLRAFGSGPSPFRSAHDIFRLCAAVPVDSLPYLYLAVGVQDENPIRLTMHRALAEDLGDYGAFYEYHEVPGTHSTQFFDVALQPMLLRLNEILQRGYRSIAMAMRHAITTKGVVDGTRLFYALRNNHSAYIDEEEMKDLGYELLSLKKTEAAIAVLKITTESFPRSSDAFARLARAHERAGDKAGALRNYRRAAELDPKDSSLTEMVRKLEAESEVE
jgi:S-formylglutathione hydrolase FrmB